MLTKNDLSEISKLVRKETKRTVREEVEAEGERIRSEVGSEIKLAGIRTTTELREVNTRLKDLEIKTTRVEKEVKKLRSDLKNSADFLDRENLKTVKRLEKIERRLGFPELQAV